MHRFQKRMYVIEKTCWKQSEFLHALGVMLSPSLLTVKSDSAYTSGVFYAADSGTVLFKLQVTGTVTV